MTKLQSFHTFLNKRLMAAAVEIFEAYEEITMEYQEENNRLRRILQIAPEIQLCGIDSLQFSVSEEEVPPEQQHCEQELSPSLRQKDPEPTQITQKQEKIRIPQAEYPNVNRPKISEQMLFHLFLNKHLTKSVAEIFGEVEKTVGVYQEEKYCLRRMLKRLPEIKVFKIDSIQLSLSEEEVPPEQQHCEQEWSPSLGQEDPEPTQIKEEQEELRTRQDSILTPPCVKSICDQENSLWSLTEAQTQTENGEIDIKPVCLKPADTVTHLNGLDFLCDPPDNQNNVSRYSSSENSDREDIDSSPLLDLNPPLNPSPLLDLNPPLNPSSLLDLNPPLNPSPLLDLNPPLYPSPLLDLNPPLNPSSLIDLNPPLNPSPLLDLNPPLNPSPLLDLNPPLNPSSLLDLNPPLNPRSLLDLNPPLNPRSLLDLNPPLNPSSLLDLNPPLNPSPLLDLNPPMNPSLPLDLNPPVRIHRSKRNTTSSKTHVCQDCGEAFHLQADLQSHVTLAKKTSSKCVFCRKCYRSSCKLKAHVRLCHSDKPFACPFCCKMFKRNKNLTIHIRLHTGEEPFSCDDCGERFNQKWQCNVHKQMHRRQKQFSCDECGKHFSMKGNLTVHKLTHTGEKPFSCNEWEKLQCEG